MVHLGYNFSFVKAEFGVNPASILRLIFLYGSSSWIKYFATFLYSFVCLWQWWELKIQVNFYRWIANCSIAFYLNNDSFFTKLPLNFHGQFLDQICTGLCLNSIFCYVGLSVFRSLTILMLLLYNKHKCSKFVFVCEVVLDIHNPFHFPISLSFKNYLLEF
jgi:hypothetical protein